MSANNILLHGLTTAIAVGAAAAANVGKDCHGKRCHAVEEFCSTFSESCVQCSSICDASSHNYHADMCAKECADYNKYDPLKADIHAIQNQQRIMLILLIVLLLLIAIRYAYKVLRWLRHKRCITNLMKKLQGKKPNPPAQTGKDGNVGGTTIENVLAINEMARTPSQVYSMTGAEGSVITMTTPVSTRFPTESASTPSTIAAQYSYDNEALAVTPVAEKPQVVINGPTFARN